MYDAMRATHPSSVLFFVTLVVSGQIIMLNLFIAVLLENFELQRLEQEKMKKLESNRADRVTFKDQMLDELEKLKICTKCINRFRSRVKKYGNNQLDTTIAPVS